MRKNGFIALKNSMKTKIGVAKELSKANVPGIVISGNDSNGSSPMNAVGLKYLMDINDKLTTK